ncbi:MAG: hypothetical protein ACR2L2_07125 [Acidobacteriota bacterium]
MSSAKDVIVLVGVLVLVHVFMAVIDYPYPSGYGTDTGGAFQGCVLFLRGVETPES